MAMIVLMLYIYSFSRRIMWLRVGVTNKDPKVIAGFYLDTVQNIRGIVTMYVSRQFNNA